MIFVAHLVVTDPTVYVEILIESLGIRRYETKDVFVFITTISRQKSEKSKRDGVKILMFLDDLT